MNSIRSKLIIYILLATIIPVAAFLIYTLMFVNDGLKETEFDAQNTKISWGSQFLDQVTEQLDDIMYSIHLEDDLLSMVDNSSTDYDEMEDLLRDTLYNNSNILSKVTVISINSHRGVSFDYENGFASEVYQYNDPLLVLNDETHGMTFLRDGSDIVVLHTINSFKTQELLGMMYLRLSRDTKDELESILETSTMYALFTSNQTLINDSDVSSESLYQLYNAESRTSTLDDNYIWTKQVRDYDLYVSLIVPSQQINAFSRNMIGVGVLIIVLSFLVSVFISVFFVNDITKPLVSLITHMKETELKQYTSGKNTYREMDELQTAYNQMIYEINTLITDKYRNEIERQSIQLKALQAQINPHFLANTFQLIGGMALNEGATDIYDATIKMSNLVRYSMRIEQEAVTIQQELEHIREYLDIQKLRFGDRLDFIVEIDQKTLQKQIPKFTIQPIIENSFKYGLKKVDRTWNISITSKTTTNTTICIKDNGVGIDEALLTELNNQFKNNTATLINTELDKKSIGLMNIDSRIKLLYGMSYGLKIENNVDFGITVWITLPKGGTQK